MATSGVGGASRRRGAGRDAGSIVNAAAFQDHLARNLHMPTLAPAYRTGVGAGRGRRKQAAPPARAQPSTLEEELDIRLGLKIEEEREEKVGPKLSLAQKRGLAPAPPPRLTADEWKATKAAAIVRSCGGDCPICMENLGADDQVILSCSHVFHKACLRSFEVFSQSKVCPLCRRESYEKRLFPEGRLIYYHECALKLQALYRGHLARKEYAKLQELYPPQDPNRRKKFFEKKLGKLTDSYVKEQEETEDEIEKLFSEIDKTLKKSRKLFGTAPPVSAAKALEDSLWELAERKAREREDEDCAICLQQLKGKQGVLLDCSHYFHAQCLSALEAFTADMPVHHCPICRGVYKKKNMRIDS